MAESLGGALLRTWNDSRVGLVPVAAIEMAPEERGLAELGE